jgi:hypothetical protein
VQVRAEADDKSRLFQYYLLDSTGFEPSVFTTTIPGLNDDPSTMLTVFGANCGLPTIGSVRIELEPKPDLPTDPDDPRAFSDVFTDIRGLFVINNESGWYEGWMIHDLRVADVVGEPDTKGGENSDQRKHDSPTCEPPWGRPTTPPGTSSPSMENAPHFRARATTSRTR